MNSKGQFSIRRRTLKASKCDARLTSVVSIPKSSKVFLYIGRLLLALFETNRTFLPAITIARSACYTFSTHTYKQATQRSTRRPTLCSQPGDDLPDTRDELGTGPDDAIAVKEKGVKLVDERGIVLRGGQTFALGSVGHRDDGSWYDGRGLHSADRLK